MPHSTHLAIIALMAAAALLFYFLYRRTQAFARPHIRYSDIKGLSEGERARWASLPNQLLWMALGTFAAAMLDPHYFVAKHRGAPGAPPAHNPVEGIAIYLVLDQSGSMNEPVSAENTGALTKVDLMRQVSKAFVEGDARFGLQGRPNDLIGLITFARAARVLAPLTLDHEAVVHELDKLRPVGSKDQDGTSIGYAIYKTASMIAATRRYAEELAGKGEPAYAIKNSVMILITDGLQDPNPLDRGKRLRNMDVPEAAAFAKEQGIRLYIVNVEPKLSSEEFLPYRNIMQRAAESTGGRFFAVGANANLAGIYQGIDALEKSDLPPPVNKALRPDLYSRVSLYPVLIALGLLCLFAALTLEVTVFRRVP